MKDIDLNEEDIRKVAELIIKTNLEEIKFTPTEAKLLFNLDNNPIDLKDFAWNISAGFIKGKIQAGIINEIIVHETVIYPPRLLVSNYIESYSWHPLAIVAASLEFMNSALSSPNLLEKIMHHLDDKFEYLSLGQAKAIIKRKLEISLSQVERNDLSRLRKKFDGYQRLIDAFSDMVDKKAGLRRPYKAAYDHSSEEYLSSVHFKLKFMCTECKTYVEFPDSAKPVIVPEHHGSPMTITWGGHLSAEESTKGFQELSDAVTKGLSGLDQIEPVTLTEEGKIVLINTRDKLIDQINDLVAEHSNESGFNPAESLAALKPTPKQEKIESKMDIQYFCTVCSQTFDISDDEKFSILRSDDATKIHHPEHHGKEMEIKLLERD